MSPAATDSDMRLGVPTRRAVGTPSGRLRAAVRGDGRAVQTARRGLQVTRLRRADTHPG